MDRGTRIEENEKLFREVNERVAELHRGVESGPDPEWVCECGDETCFDKVALPLADYQEIRARNDWFLVKPGHEKVDVERVVRREERYLVVEKYGVVPY
jgi:hypothetical protein